MTTSSVLIIFFLDFFVPFWLLCSYKLLKSMSVMFVPVLIIPSMLFLSTFCYIATSNFHFLTDGALFLVVYFTLTVKLGYSRPDAFVLTSLCTIACDQLWQVPWYVTFYWTGDLWHLQNGLIAAPFALMAIPLIPYFLMKMGRGLSLDLLSKSLLLINGGLLIGASIIYRFQGLDYSGLYYFLYLTWSVFFLAFFRSSALKYPVTRAN